MSSAVVGDVLEAGAQGVAEPRPALAGARRPRRAVALHLTAVLAGVAWLVGAFLLPPPAGGLLVLLAMLVGPGSAAVAWLPRLPLSLAAALVPAIGIAVGTGWAGVAIQAPGWWHPVWFTWVLALTTTAVGAAGLALTRRDWATVTTWRPPLPRSAASLAASLAGLVILLATVALMGGRPVGDTGLLVAMPPLALGLVLAVVALVLAVLRNDSVAAAVATGVTLLTLRLPPILQTTAATPFYAYAHLGVVDLFTRTGRVHPEVDIYSSWPGFFAQMAWIDAHGAMGDTIARWFPLGFHVLQAVAIVALARALGLSPRAAALAAFIGEIANWVGQDYYSPQAAALVMALVVLATLLTRGLGRSTWIVLPITAATVLTHQLTPVWLLIVVWGIVLVHSRRLWPLALVMTAMVGGYVWIHLDVVAPYGLFTKPALDNLDSNIPTAGTAGRQLAQLVVRVTAVLLWAMAVLVLVRRWRRGQPVLLRGGLTFASFLILGGQSYGGEAIFRVLLYSIPGAALLLAEAVEDALDPAGWEAGNASRARLGRAAVLPVLLAYTLLGAQASLGSWTVQKVSPDEVRGTAAVLKELPAPALVLPLAPGAPVRPVAEYAELARANSRFDTSLAGRADFRELTFETQADLDQLKDLVGPQRDPVYLVFSPAMRNYARFYGLMAPEAYDRFVDLVAASPDFRREAAHVGGVTVYRWVGAPKA